MEGRRAAPMPCLVLEEIFRVASALPEDVRPGPNPGIILWSLVIWAAVGFFVVVLFWGRSVQSFRSRLSVGRELALKHSELLEEKWKLLEKFSLVQKGYAGLDSSLKDAGFVKESREAANLEGTYEKQNRSKSVLEDEILILEKKLKEEKSKHSHQDALMPNIAKKVKSLEEGSKSLKSQVPEAKSTFRILQMKEKDLKAAMQEALSENYQLQESHKILLQEAEVWKEKVSDLHKRKTTLEECKVQAEEVPRDTENHIKSVTERLPRMKVGAPVFLEDLKDAGNLKLEVKTESEIGTQFCNLPKGDLKEMVYAVKLNASLHTLEGERNQIHTSLFAVEETDEDLLECIKNLETEGKSLRSEHTQCENENGKLQQNLDLMTELYEENEVNLFRKLIAEETCRLEEEERLCRVAKRISLAAKQLETFRKQAKGFEEELESTIHFYERQILFYENKTRDDDLATSTSGRNLEYLRKVNSHNRPKLIEIEFGFKSLEKDPYITDVPNTAFGREHGSENQATGSGFVFVSLLPVRNPSLRVDPRRNFMRRGTFLPPPPPANMYAASRDYFPPGSPPLPFPVKISIH